MKGSELLLQAIEKSVRSNPHKICIIDTNTDKKLLYKELLNAIFALQKYFGANSQTVLLAIPGGVSNAIVWLTAMIFGHRLIPISPSATEFEYNKLLKKYKPTIIISNIISKKDSWISKHHTKQLTHSQLQSVITKGIESNATINTNVKPDDGTVYMETSGSTGAPKNLHLTASKIVITANNIRKFYKLTKEDRCFTPLPFYYVTGPVASLMTSVLSGGTVIIAPKFSASHFWGLIKKYDPTWISIVPAILAILLKYDKHVFFKKSSLRFIRTGSSPLPKANLIKFEEKYGFPVIETYGCTETATTIASNPLPPKKHKIGSVGLPIGIHVKLMNSETGQKVTQGEVGEVWVKGPQVIENYEGGRDATSFKDGWFNTGDLGYFDKDGYLFLTGRKKEVIIRGGENIFPREIEEVLATYPGITEIAVVGKPDKIFGEKVVAFLVDENSRENDLIYKIKNFASTKLTPQKVPAEIYILKSLPHGKSNKIDKYLLKNFYP